MKIVKYSDHVICMDANLSDRTFNVLKFIRGVPRESPEKPVEYLEHLIVNTKKKIDNNVIVYTHEQKMNDIFME